MRPKAMHEDSESARACVAPNIEKRDRCVKGKVSGRGLSGGQVGFCIGEKRCRKILLDIIMTLT
jgi:hypothetical protein